MAEVYDDWYATPPDTGACVERLAALARGARMHGATIVEGARVEGFTMAANRITAVRTGPVVSAALHIAVPFNPPRAARRHRANSPPPRNVRRRAPPWARRPSPPR